MSDVSGKIEAVTINAKSGPRPAHRTTRFSTTGPSISDDVQNGHTVIRTSTMKDGRTTEIVMDLTGSQYGWLSAEGLLQWGSHFEQRAVSEIESMLLMKFREQFDQNVGSTDNNPDLWDKVSEAERLVLNHAQKRLENWLREQGVEMKEFLELPDAEFVTKSALLVEDVVGAMDNIVDSLRINGMCRFSRDAAGVLG